MPQSATETALPDRATAGDGKPQRLDPELRADLIEFARARIESVWTDVPGGVDAATRAGNVVAAQEFCWMSRQIPVSVQTVEGEVETLRAEIRRLGRLLNMSTAEIHALHEELDDDVPTAAQWDAEAHS